MKVNLKLGRVGMQMEEATIAAWRIAPGEAFKLGQTLYEIETEKVVQEIEAPGDGVLVEIKVPAGDIASVGQVVCVVEIPAVGKVG